jgi:O-antigen/teichoic acid export membrane protein
MKIPRSNAMDDSRHERERFVDSAGLIKNSAVYFLSDLFLKLIGFLLVPLYTRILTTQDYGILGYSNALTQILSPIVGLGLVGSMPILYYAYNGHERRRLISSVINCTFIYSLVLTVIFSVVGSPVFTLVSNKVSFNPYIILTIWGLFFSSFFYLPLGIFNMREKAVSYAAYSIGLSLISILLNVLFIAVLRWGAAGALFAGLISGAIGMIAAVFILRGDYLPVMDWGKLKSVFILALPTLPHVLSANLWRFSDRIFLTKLADLSSTGIYTLAMTLSSLLAMVVGGIASALNPHFFKRANSGDARLSADWARFYSLFVFVVIFAGVFLIALGPELIKIIAPPKYYPAIGLIPLLTIGQIISGMHFLMAPGVGFSRKMWVYPLASIPAVIVNIILNFMLIPSLGIFGAAWALAGSAAVQFVIFAYFSNKIFPFVYEYKQIAKVIVAGGFLGVVLYYLTIENPWMGILIKTPLLILLPAGLFGFGFFSKSEIQWFKQSIRRLVSRVCSLTTV